MNSWWNKGNEYLSTLRFQFAVQTATLHYVLALIKPNRPVASKLMAKACFALQDSDNAVRDFPVVVFVVPNVFLMEPNDRHHYFIFKLLWKSEVN